MGIYDETEDALAWVQPMLATHNLSSAVHLRVYCKGVAAPMSCEKITNHGGEEYGFLHHMVHNYDSLAKITIFTQPSVQSPLYHYRKCRKLNYVLSQLQTPEQRSGFRGFTSINDKYQGGASVEFDPDFDIFEWHSEV